MLAGKKPGEKVGRLTAEQAEIARLTCGLDRANKRLHITKTALDIMGRAHALLESFRERGFRREAQEAMTETYAGLMLAISPPGGQRS